MNNGFDFRAIAQQELSLSPLMTGREQIKTDDLIGKELTISEFDFATITDEHGEEKTFPVVLFTELPTVYYNGGALLNKLCMAWTAEFDGDILEASQSLRESGGVKVRFKATRTKRGNNLTTLEVL